MGAQLHRIVAAASVEPPQPVAEEKTKDHKHCSRAQQESYPIGEVLVFIAGTLKRDHRKDSLSPNSHESHETVANGGFLVHEETQDSLEVIHDVSHKVSQTHTQEIKCER